MELISRIKRWWPDITGLGSFCGGAAIPTTTVTALIAESEAAIQGLLLAGVMNKKKVIMESECSTFIDSINNSKSRDWTILRMESNFESVEWFWSPRNLNMKWQGLVWVRWICKDGLIGHLRPWFVFWFQMVSLVPHKGPGWFVSIADNGRGVCYIFYAF
ncbi:hypothetical protein L3X38_037250 [Prunus dulcis]|uniref:RNase H type-1 domain-containing protein n=1 Tax=Prunus dulcis TaxID=3755 RepID=A0AAD4YR38_PRUDU|nr:hypothetical protein L3X38_037250 [Prunus dulcis]